MSAFRDQVRASAFVAHGAMTMAGAPEGPLAGLTFAAKDLFDVAGLRSGWGNPDRLAEAPLARAPATGLLPALAAGATLIGKTHTDELASGMFGENPHYGPPINPRAPGRVPGGSSSGSAAAVAAQRGGERRRDHAGDGVRIAAGGEALHQGDRPFRPALCEGRQRQHPGGKKDATGDHRCLPPSTTIGVPVECRRCTTAA
ncbi:hypothetical protein J4558_26620 [Leptolyngbya sp. 15MV]|nr:hypothetical protein J4558_26620 [Leptolyngbya sp. 15MV]